ncbi:MAG: hypothetical protein FH762_20095 [Firmicutes bacterium]|nr:hypothetical protein [Bacillota bacterium]
MKHTPGPWIPGAASEKADIIIVAPNCTNLEDRYHPIAKVHRNHSDKHANAQLIAAAPELLEACEVAEGFAEWCTETANPEFNEEAQRALDMIRSAIDKSKGDDES